MPFVRELQRLLLALLLGFMAVGITAIYWASTGPERLLPREDNPRNVIARESIQRGDIVDRNRTALALSVEDNDGDVTREYLYPAMYSALGYYSFRYGEGGAEAAFNDYLTGDIMTPDLATYFEQGVLHQPQQGVDVQLTLDLPTQRSLMKALDGLNGTGIVLSVPDGGVIAMVSTPTYDPNKLDATWDSLIDAPGEPFFNRALQGTYQPGSAIYTLLMTAAILQGIPLDEASPNATEAVTIGETTLTCTAPPPDDTLTLSQAYAYGCPAPFQALAGTIGLDTLESIFELYQLDNPFTLEENYTPPPELSDTDEAIDALTTQLEDGSTSILQVVNPVFRLHEALGQGTITINPLHMTAITASIINAGNAPQPFTLVATRPPDQSEWQSVSIMRDSLPITTPTVARQMQTIMIESLETILAEVGQEVIMIDETISIGGHAALAYSGEGTLVWFTGFAGIDTRRGYAITIILEDSDDLSLATQIGYTTLINTIINSEAEVEGNQD